MLRKIFNKAARPPYIPEKPVVLVSTLGDDPMRGDSHGYIGIGKLVAEKLGGEYHYIDDDMLSTLYPGQKNQDLALAAYLGKIGAPDIVFARFSKDWQKICGQPPFTIDNINETLIPIHASEKEIVAHHITPELFKSEGHKFAAAYPDIPRPLVAVMMANATSHGLSSLLIPAIKDFRESSIFVCSGRRTNEYAYGAMISSLSTSIDKAGLNDRVKILEYPYHARGKDTYNPYIGLLDQSDHVIVCGDSQSIVSEAIASGKSVHLFGGDDNYKRMEKKGLVKQFKKYAGNPLESHAITPVNPTEKAAESIVKSYIRHQQLGLGFWRGVAAFLMDR